MTQPKQEDIPAVMTKLEWGVVLSFLVSSASLVFSAGVVWTKVQVHDAAIASLNQTQVGNADRLARIETKLDIILADKAETKK